MDIMELREMLESLSRIAVMTNDAAGSVLSVQLSSPPELEIRERETGLFDACCFLGDFFDSKDGEQQEIHRLLRGCIPDADIDFNGTQFVITLTAVSGTEVLEFLENHLPLFENEIWKCTAAEIAANLNKRKGYIMRMDSELHQAAEKRDWNKVRTLLDAECPAGQAPEEAVIPNGGRTALYFALIAGEFEIASRLYERGERLDEPLQNCGGELEENNSVPGYLILQFLSHESSYGRNYFVNETRTLAECCRHALLHQAENRLPSAAASELADALFEFPQGFIKQKSTKLMLAFLHKLLDRDAGAILLRNSPEKFRELLESFDRIRQWPAPLAVDDPSALKTFADAIEKATAKRNR